MALVQRLVADLRAYLRAGVVILEYHRVAELETDAFRLAVTPEHFAEHLAVLPRLGRVLPLRQAALALRDGRLPRRGIVVTVDDGYADNLYSALPLLERYDVPATIFVTTGGIGSRREFWWDELERLILSPGSLPEALYGEIGSRTFKWELGEAANFDTIQYRQHRQWHYGHLDRPTPRHALFDVLYRVMTGLSPDERSALLEHLAGQASLDLEARHTHRSLTAEEVQQLSKGELVEIGAHTVMHPILANLEENDQSWELKESKACLEGLIGQPVTSFAYPHGMPMHYNAATVALVQAAGYTIGCSTIHGAVRARSDIFQLPRVPVLDCDGETFFRQISALLPGIPS